MVHQGTSVAAAHTTGVLALMLQERRLKGLPDLAPVEARALLTARSRARPDEVTGPLPNPSFGHGRLTLLESPVGPSLRASVVDPVIVACEPDRGEESDPAGHRCPFPGPPVIRRGGAVCIRGTKAEARLSVDVLPYGKSISPRRSGSPGSTRPTCVGLGEQVRTSLGGLVRRPNYRCGAWD